MNPTFNIQAPDINYTSAHLVIEAGPRGISIVISDTSNCFVAVVLYTFPATFSAAALSDKFDEVIKGEPVLQHAFKKTDIIWTFTESILVPPAYMETASNGDLLELIFGDLNNNTVSTDFLYKHNLHNVYRIPLEICNSFKRYFPAASYSHQYSILPQLVNRPGNHLLVVFYDSGLTLVLCKAGNLQVIRNFHYQHPADAAYYLLNVCDNFEINNEDIILHLSGMIDKGSALYTELYKYFLNIQFEELPEHAGYIDAVKDQPHHYFSHSFAIAACV